LSRRILPSDAAQIPAPAAGVRTHRLRGGLPPRYNLHSLDCFVSQGGFISLIFRRANGRTQNVRRNGGGRLKITKRFLVLVILIPVITAASSRRDSLVNGQKTAPGPDWSALMSAMDKMHATMASVQPSGSSDMDFVRLMLAHHQAAIEMAKTQLLYGKDPQMRRLAQEIVTDQQSEIQLMQLWLKQHGPGSPQEKPAAARSGPEER
jgi:Domain of unknown function (DUF305)